MAPKVGYSPFIQLPLATAGTVGESTRAAAAGSASPALTKVDMQNIEAIAARRAGSIDTKDIDHSQTVISNPVRRIEPQQDVVKFGTREALSYINQPKSQSAVAFNNVVAASGYPTSLSLNNEKQGLNIIS